tara:strand:- start:1252 stop:1683 length:432 start_codon:yes stop_codon:yes gene_type:complete
MELISKGDKINVRYTLLVDKEIVRDEHDTNIIIGAESNLKGLNDYIEPFINKEKSKIEGLEASLFILPDNGYGKTDKSKIGAIPKELMDSGISVGDSVDLSFKDGSTLKGIVKSENEDTFIIDCNHPLVNKILNVRIKFGKFV